MMRRTFAVAATLLLAGTLALGGTSAHADTPAPFMWPPPAPTAYDPCGTRYDGIDVPWISDVSWFDESGSQLDENSRTPTGGRAAVTITARHVYYDGETWVTDEHTFAPLSFGTEPDSSCRAGAPDTVAVADLVCNKATSGTRATFTYANPADATTWPRTDVWLTVDRWDEGQHNYLSFTDTLRPEVADGDQVVVTGGDTPMGFGENRFFLAPGTYNLRLHSDEAGTRSLPRLFVPSCGDETPPTGDPRGAAAPSLPRGYIQMSKDHAEARVVMTTNQYDATSRFKIILTRGGGTRTTKHLVVSKRTVVRYRLRHGDVLQLLGRGGTIWMPLGRVRG